MPTTLHASRKRLGRLSVMATAASQKHHRLYSWDRHSGRRSLVDMEVEVSILPPLSTNTRSLKKGPPLTAINSSNIRTFGVRTIPLNFNSCCFKWTFTIADVSQPLLGADFLRAHSLLVDEKGQRLVNSETFESIALHHAELTALHLGSVTSSDNE